MRVRISHLVNSLTLQALYEKAPGHVGKETVFDALVERPCRQSGAGAPHPNCTPFGCLALPRRRLPIRASNGFVRQSLARIACRSPEANAPLLRALESA